MNGISKGTIVRTIMLIIVLINLGLKATGKHVFNISESEVYCIVEYLIDAGIIVLTFWKNNSFTNNAIKADEFLDFLKAVDTYDDDDDDDEE